MDECSIVPTITPQAAWEKAASGKAMLFDVREPHEWKKTGSPVGCVQVALLSEDLVMRILSIVGDRKEQPIIVCCESGSRGDAAGRLLCSAEFVNVHNVEGGIAHWISKGLPLDKLG